jgi:hypothetical protein
MLDETGTEASNISADPRVSSYFRKQRDLELEQMVAKAEVARTEYEIAKLHVEWFELDNSD